MTAIRYTVFLSFSLIILSIQIAHATNGYQPKTRWMSMDLSHTLTFFSSTSTSAKQANLFQYLAVQESTIIKNTFSATDSTRNTTALMLDHNSQSIHGKPMDNSQQQQAWLTIKHDHELISNISVPARDELLNQSQQLLTILDAKQATLSQAAQNTAFDAKDAFISIIMPGGLLYASHRKLAHTKAKKQLIQAISERNMLAMDISMLQSTSNTTTLAMLD